MSVDGGFDYMKGSWDQKRIPKMPTPFEFGVDATKKELYADWNSNGTKFGLIEPAKPERPATAGADRSRTRRTLPVDRKPTAPRRQKTRVLR